MDECQLLVVYRAGTEKSPRFRPIMNDKVWLIKNPALYYPLDNQEAVKPTVCLWKAEINKSSLAIEDHPKFEGVCVVKDKRKVKILPWKRSPVPHIQPGLSMMDSQVVSQAVLHFLIDNPPITPEDFNFQAELKAASHWHWPESDDEPLKLVSGPHDDLRVKMVAADALKSWKEELRKATIQENTDSSDLEEYISDLEEVIFNLSMYYKGTLEETDDDNTASITSHNNDKRSKTEKRVSPRRKRKQSEEDNMNSPEKRSSQHPCTHDSRLLITAH